MAQKRESAVLHRTVQAAGPQKCPQKTGVLSEGMKNEYKSLSGQKGMEVEEGDMAYAKARQYRIAYVSGSCQQFPMTGQRGEVGAAGPG